MASDQIWVYCRRCRSSYPERYRICPRDGEALTRTTMDPLLGAVLDGRYRIEHQIGKGALGRVYRAQHVRMTRRYAIKVPACGTSLQEQATLRLLNEADAGGRIDHPNVVSVLDVGETALGQPYLVMELAEGETLHARLSRTSRLPVDAALALTRQLALGLEHVHGRGLVHRDLAPGNVVVTPDGRARIVDFGLALVLDGDTKRLTGPGLAIGTPAYMAPEQAAGEEIDARADLFSLGVLLYHMITGDVPFNDEPGEARPANYQVVPRLGEAGRGLMADRGVDDLIHRMLARNRSERIDSATAVLGAIETIQDRHAASGPGRHPDRGARSIELTEFPTERIVSRSIRRHATQASADSRTDSESSDPSRSGTGKR